MMQAEDVKVASDSDVAAISERLLKQNRQAYEELAKRKTGR